MAHMGPAFKDIGLGIRVDTNCIELGSGDFTTP